MHDHKPIGNPYKEPRITTGRWTGANNAAPVAMTAAASAGSPASSLCKHLAIARTGTGALTISFVDDLSTNVVGGLGVELASFWDCHSPNNHKMVECQPYVAGSNQWLLQVVWTANNAAVDLQSYEELTALVISSKSQNP